MYPVESDIKDTTESNASASYADLLPSIGRDGQLHISIYDIRDYFNFHIPYSLFLSSNIPSSFAYFFFNRATYTKCFIMRVTQLSNKLLEQEHDK